MRARAGNPDGTYLQDVPLVGIRPDPNMQLTFTGHGKTLHARYQKDFVARRGAFVDSVELDADMISSATACRRPNTNGTISRAWT